MIHIHDFPRGARGLRALWICEELSLPYTFHPVSFPADAPYLALNPLGTVPLLRDGDVQIIESVAMMLYLAGTHGPTPLLPPPGAAYARMLELAVFAEATFGGCINPLLAARFAAPPEERDNWSVRRLQARATSYVDYLAARLGDAAYLVGDTLTLADISVEIGLRIWHGALDGAMPDNLAAYRARLALVPAYQRAIASRGT
jgi:glutathione S-transferase